MFIDNLIFQLWAAWAAERRCLLSPDVTEDVRISEPTREVYLLGGITAQNVRQVGSEILLLFKQDPSQPINLVLTSGGGEVDPAIAFCEFVRIKQIPLIVTVYFSADSAAIAILCAGNVRRATNNSTFFFHPISKPTGNDRLTEKDFLYHARDIRHSTNVYCAFIAQATRKTEAEIEELMESGRTLNADEAKVFGLIHEIVEVPTAKS